MDLSEPRFSSSAKWEEVRGGIRIQLHHAVPVPSSGESSINSPLGPSSTPGQGRAAAAPRPAEDGALMGIVLGESQGRPCPSSQPHPPAENGGTRKGSPVPHRSPPLLSYTCFLPPLLGLPIKGPASAPGRITCFQPLFREQGGSRTGPGFLGVSPYLGTVCWERHGRCSHAPPALSLP